MDAKWIAVVLVGGAVVIKGAMQILDKSGALERLPPYLRPQVSAVMAGVAGLLMALAGGVEPQDALLAALGAGYVSDKMHATIRGVHKGKR